ncbi:hypothetical protein [Poinsettia branch-inducing phytoplasma]|uniref:hypothetical protein n=1 Tax=Poinsettia branch-inducing phytoplasma TaxID=138647 RepID=UPI00035DB51B|nr:hypothetical protein [Poinsettia branch-inducing phytoplasma]
MPNQIKKSKKQIKHFKKFHNIFHRLIFKYYNRNAKTLQKTENMALIDVFINSLELIYSQTPKNYLNFSNKYWDEHYAVFGFDIYDNNFLIRGKMTVFYLENKEDIIPIIKSNQEEISSWNDLNILIFLDRNKKHRVANLNKTIQELNKEEQFMTHSIENDVVILKDDLIPNLKTLIYFLHFPIFKS